MIVAPAPPHTISIAARGDAIARRRARFRARTRSRRGSPSRPRAARTGRRRWSGRRARSRRRCRARARAADRGAGLRTSAAVKVTLGPGVGGKQAADHRGAKGRDRNRSDSGRAPRNARRAAEVRLHGGRVRRDRMHPTTTISNSDRSFALVKNSAPCLPRSRPRRFAAVSSAITAIAPKRSPESPKAARADPKLRTEHREHHPAEARKGDRDRRDRAGLDHQQAASIRTKTPTSRRRPRADRRTGRPPAASSRPTRHTRARPQSSSGPRRSRLPAARRAIRPGATISAETMKMPEPIIEPATKVAESNSERSGFQLSGFGNG